MKVSYCLISQSWIPCLMPDGTNREFGLAEALSRAHEITAISDPSPPVVISLYRLLLAILHRVFGPRNSQEWRALWEAGRFDAERLEGYFTQWQHRFDLFDVERPFYQVAGMDRKMLKPVTALMPQATSGNNAALFDHSLNEWPSEVKSNAAARLVLVQQNYALGGLYGAETGRVSTTAAPLVTGAAVLAVGRSLFETLAENLLIYHPQSNLPMVCHDDSPAWEQDHAATAEVRHPAGYLDYLSWQSRRLWLSPLSTEGGEPRVAEAIISNAREFPRDYFFRNDSMVVYLRREKAKSNENPWPALRFSEDRALWRDSIALLQSATDVRQRAGVMDHLQLCIEEGALAADTVLDLAAFGLCSNQAKMIFWRQERQPLPLHYLTQPELVEQLGQCLAMVEQVASHLSGAVCLLESELLAPSERSADKNAIRTAADGTGAMRAYWSSLEPHFHRLVVSLSNYGADTDAVGRDWATLVCRTARTTLDEVIDGLKQDGRTLRSGALARRALAKRLNQLTAPLKEVNDDATQ